MQLQISAMWNNLSTILYGLERALGQKQLYLSGE
jgi:hypothetical protein